MTKLQMNSISNTQQQVQNPLKASGLKTESVDATNMLSATFFLQLAGKQDVTGVDNPEYSKLPMARGVSFHSGRVREGDAFFALSGEHGHGIKFAEQALASGAAFIITDVAYEQAPEKCILVDDPAALLLTVGKEARQAIQGPVIAVTGSAGKTSSKAMLAASLDSGKSPGNFNTPLALARVLVDTWLAGEITAEHKLVLELGIDHPGEMDILLDLVQPTHGLITVIAESHLSELGSIEVVAREKTKLIAAAEQTLVSSATFERLTEEQRKQVIVYGLVSDLDSDTESFKGVKGRLGSTGLKGQSIEVLDQMIDLPYLGDVMATNAVGAMAMAQLLEVDLVSAAKRLEAVELEPHRLQLRNGKNFLILDDCYNSNPVSLTSAFEVIKTLPKPHCVILGDMLELGELSESLHRSAGQASQGFDSVICIGNEAKYIAEENSAANYFEDFETAQAYIDGLNLSGTVLLKASRGMRFERLLSSLEASSAEGQA